MHTFCGILGTQLQTLCQAVQCVTSDRGRYVITMIVNYIVDQELVGQEHSQLRVHCVVHVPLTLLQKDHGNIKRKHSKCHL